jgi:hypothetical protein
MSEMTLAGGEQISATAVSRLEAPVATIPAEPETELGDVARAIVASYGEEEPRAPEHGVRIRCLR